MSMTKQIGRWMKRRHDYPRPTLKHGSGETRRADGTRISDWMHAPAKNIRGKPRPASTYRAARRNEARTLYRAKGHVA